MPDFTHLLDPFIAKIELQRTDSPETLEMPCPKDRVRRKKPLGVEIRTGRFAVAQLLHKIK
jgi:hypothetical protein